MNKRPKRTIFKKNLEFNEGLHWQEERDLCRALYASLQPSRGERSAFDHQENGDSEMTDSGEVNSSSCPEEDSTESSSFCPPLSITDSGDMGSESTCSTDHEKIEVPQFNHVPRTLTQRMKRCKERNRKKHKPKKEHKKRSPSLKLEFFEKQDELKNKKIHAQRKFAVSYSPSVSPNKPSPLSTPLLKSKLGISENESGSILNFSPKTEDFLTFLCLRGTSALPGRLDLLKKSHQKSHKKKEEALKGHDITKSDITPSKDSIIRRKKRERSLVQKAKAVRTLNNIKKQSRQRPWRECKQLVEISNQISKRDSAISEAPSGHLTPPCLSPIPPPIVTVTQHHNPPPLIPILPLDGSKKCKMPEKVECKKNLAPLTKLRKRQREASRTTSHQSANSTNAAVEGHQVLLKRKLRSSTDEETNELEKTLIAKGGRVKVELLKNEVKDILQRRNNSIIPPLGSKVTKKWKAEIFNGGVTHGRVTRANVSKGGAVDGLVLNGKRRGRKKKNKIVKEQNTLRKKTETKKETTPALGVVKEEKKTESKNEVAPRRSTRKRILRFDVHCVYTGLLSSNNTIIQSANCICPCCKTEDRRPRKRSKVQEKKQHFLRNQDKGKESNRKGDNKNVISKLGRSDDDLSKTETLKVASEPKQVKQETTQEVTQEKEKNHILEKDDIHNNGCTQAAATRTNLKNLTGLNNNLNGSFEAKEVPSSPIKSMAFQEKRTPLKSNRNLGKQFKVKTDDIYKNGEVIVKKLRNGTNLSLEEFNVNTGKYGLKDEISTGSLDQPTGNCTPPSERKRGLKNVIVKKKFSQQPLRRKLEKQFSCATKPVSNLSSKPKCRIPVTLPALASNCLIKDIQHPPPHPPPLPLHSTTSSSTNLTAVPTFHPTHQEWSNLLAYLESKAKTIEMYGMCKVKPPVGREPSGIFPDSLRITPEIQYVHRLQHRWSSSSKRLACLKRHLERKEKVAFQPPQICGCEVDLLKFAELISLEGGFKAVRTKKKWPKLADQLNIPRTVSGRTNKLESICLKYLVSFSNLSQAEKDELMREVEMERYHRLDEAGRTNPFGVTESEVRRGGHQISLCQFKQRADLLEQIIRAGEDNTPCDVENEFWKIVEESDSYIAVQKAEIQGCANESNLCTLTENCGNILSVLPAATKQKLPTLKVGTVYSVEPWRASSHGLGRFEYLHSGNHKIWYSIPKCQAALLERVLQQHAAEFETKGQSCLYDKSFILMLPPNMLQKCGLTVYQAVQQPRELLVQWYGAATSSISCGFHIAESFPLASSDWLEGAIQAFEVSKSLSLPSLFSLEQLLYLLIEDIWSGRKACVGLVDKLLPVFRSFRNREISLRNRLQSCGLKLMALADKTPSSPARGSRSPGRSGPRPQDEELSQCITCNHHCYFSMVMNERENKVYCLDHATELFNNGKGYPGWTVYYRIGQEKMTEVVKVLSHALPSTQSGHREDLAHNFVPTLGEAVVA